VLLETRCAACVKRQAHLLASALPARGVPGRGPRCPRPGARGWRAGHRSWPCGPTESRLRPVRDPEAAVSAAARAEVASGGGAGWARRGSGRRTMMFVHGRVKNLVPRTTFPAPCPLAKRPSRCSDDCPPLMPWKPYTCRGSPCASSGRYAVRAQTAPPPAPSCSTKLTRQNGARLRRVEEVDAALDGRGKHLAQLRLRPRGQASGAAERCAPRRGSERRAAQRLRRAERCRLASSYCLP